VAYRVKIIARFNNKSPAYPGAEQKFYFDGALVAELAALPGAASVPFTVF
jgi:hypothetical protein